MPLLKNLFVQNFLCFVLVDLKMQRKRDEDEDASDLKLGEGN
jgi:hypothetical protein